MKTLFTTFAGLMLAQAVSAQTCSGHSPPHAVALLELYTSEGCSSCPPADRFISGLRAAGVAPQDAVLLALHVDYWNTIGWTDRFSRAAFTERQRWLSDQVNSRTIYTPEFFIGGRELRDWSGGLPAAVRRINAQPARADIGIELGMPGSAGLPVAVKAAARAGTLHVALVESGIESKVAAGENRGRSLRHDFVVRAWLPAQELGRDGKATVAKVLPLPAGAVAANMALSAFVQGANGEVLQAYSLPLCPKL